MQAFEFLDTEPGNSEDFIVRVPKGIRSAQDLFARLADAGNFPGYFGANWNALLDCLRDFSWIPNRTVIILHADIPLQNAPEECHTYLEILSSAREDWLRPPAPDALPATPEWPYVEHDLRIVFPAASRAAIAALLG